MKKPSFAITMRLKPSHCAGSTTGAGRVRVITAARRVTTGAIGHHGVMQDDQENDEDAQIVEGGNPLRGSCIGKAGRNGKRTQERQISRGN
jgi:hypothetical protein